LQREDYAGDALAKLTEESSGTGGADAGRWARFDVRLSAAALRFMSDLHYGRVKPAAAGFNLQQMHQQLDLGASLTALAGTTDVGQALSAIEPPFHHYALLKSALEVPGPGAAPGAEEPPRDRRLAQARRCIRRSASAAPTANCPRRSTGW